MNMKHSLNMLIVALCVSACGANGGNNATGTGNNSGSNGGGNTGGNTGGNSGGPATNGDPLDTSGAESALSSEDISAMICDQYASGIVTMFESGNLCELEALGLTELCGVENGELAADADPETFAGMFITSALLDPLAAAGGLEAQVGLTVDLPGPIAAGQLAAFEIEVPGGTAEIDVLNTLNITTFMNGTALETTDAAAAASLDGVGLINADLLTLIPTSGRFLAGFVASQAYNQIQINIGGAVASVDLGDTVNVHDVCTAASPAP